MSTLKIQVLQVLEDLDTNDFKTFKWYLHGEDSSSKISWNRLENSDRLDTVKMMEDHYGSEIRAVTETVLRKMGQNGVAQKLKETKAERVDVVNVDRCQEGLRNRLKNVTVNRSSMELYTELHILKLDTIRSERAQSGQGKLTMSCNEIFNGTADKAAPLRVLTKGVSGIGKTVVTQKFILDWAEGRENQDLKFIFPIPFRELNLIDQQFSLVGLIHELFPEVKEVGPSTFIRDAVAFIFDGFDEGGESLDFQKTKKLTDITKRSTPKELLVNLIRGQLLPNARVWVTSRPAASGQIPAECFHMITEIQGFTDGQREEYLKKLLKNEEENISEQIICHVKEIRSYVMCDIPMFVWIAFRVLKDILKEKRELPKTLTELYISFFIQLTQKPGNSENKETIMTLAKLAFEQLKKGNFTFSVKDLGDCGIDIKATQTHFGLLTEGSDPQSKIYCFIHRSVQEYLAALHVHSTLVNNGINTLKIRGRLTRIHLFTRSASVKLTRVHQSAVNMALNSPHGQWDLFLRFLMGLSQMSNQRQLQELLKETQCDRKEIVRYIHRKLDRDLPLEQSMNLFHCLTELNDRTLEIRIQESVQSGPLSGQKLSPSLWSALTFLLLSKCPLAEFDLKKYCASETALLRLLPVVQASRRAQLNLCNLSERVCSELGSLLSSDSCLLIHLDLSDNDLTDSGIQRLLSALERPNHTLQGLRLRACLITAKGCASLASALKTSLPNLRELDVSYNHPGESLKLLTALQEEQHCSLQRLRFNITVRIMSHKHQVALYARLFSSVYSELLRKKVEPHGERWLRPSLKKYYCELNWETASLPKSLMMSEDQMTLKASVGKMEKSKVRCVPELSGRCYWEAECHGDVKVKVKVTSGRTAAVQKKKSWSIKYKNNRLTRKKNRHSMGGTLQFPKLEKVGVFLDISSDGAGDNEANKFRGVIHFYLMDTESAMTPAYMHNVHFSGHACAAFVFLSPGTIVRLCSPD